MIELENITYKQYLEIEDKSLYDYCIKYAYSFNKPVDHLKITDLMEYDFGIVKDLQYDFQNGITWQQLLDYICELKNIKLKDIVNNLLINLCQIKSYLKSEIERINEIESLTLSFEPEEDEIRAGIDILAPFGIYLQLRQIALTFHKSIYEIRKWKYADCFTELVCQKKISEFEKNLFEIRRKKD